MTIRVALVLCALAFLAYAAILLWFRLAEDSIIYAPDVGPIEEPDASLQLDSRDVTLSSFDGHSLRARVIPPPVAVPSDQAAWLVYLHGSSGSIGLREYNEAWAVFKRHGLGVFAIDYRGFGESEGTISEAGIYKDAEAAYDYLRKEMGIPPERILLYGFSLGSAVAIDLATRVEAAGLIVEGALLSIPRIAQGRYPFLPAALLAKNRFDSLSKIETVTIPTLFLHARKDEAIPLAHGRALYRAAKAPKEFHEIGGTHGTSHTVDKKFFEHVTKFIQARGLPVISPSDVE